MHTHRSLLLAALLVAFTPIGSAQRKGAATDSGFKATLALRRFEIPVDAPVRLGLVFTCPPTTAPRRIRAIS